ncbi:flagella biosynthesis regulatory protein FliT [Enterobacter cloacae complex sp. S4]|uniref:Flagellar protein FliT n=1 Tax=Enterobacter roggenkampii TaxID=1812935 RepID=A0AAX1WEM1_9ENTR|nr:MULTISPECIES: flagella biosynthesis regulatory protein FliT [Enterobacter cloacae complex]CAE6241622.1 Flagellar protein FliT [Enterobacter cloacae]AYY08096.1 flagella biosynthesis regulatory protein FliT [Enterobacter roggenkampii]EHF8258922.1 flagella biosynthesis regulatory protein FliT [Enterobacter roggenkampii]ELD8601365.1 flagella biosynthesis regulatory protein FliT [Enterobacter roggenkampii]MBA7914935.1 flagella biosynthesis regulatory protein FliT [Enterobacter roggenkampii]
MTNTIPSLTDWHALHALSISMLNLAHSGKWDELIEQEVKYVQIVESIAQNPISSNNMLQIERAKELLKLVLENEAELKVLLNLRMKELRELIDTTGKQQSITSTYGKLSGNILYPESFTRDTQL